MVAGLLAWLPWRGRLNTALARWGFAARWLALLALAGLVVDPGIGMRSSGDHRLILLDNSISMHSATARQDSVAALLRADVPIRRFGEAAPDVPGGLSSLQSALAAAVASGSRVELITDGEITDRMAIPADLLSRITVNVVPRRAEADVALAAVRMPERIAATDTLTVEVELRVSAGWPAGPVAIALRDGEQTLLTGETPIDGPGRYLVRLHGLLPATLTGDRWLTLVRLGAPDAEAETDVRWRHLRVTATPAVVAIVTTPDWDGREMISTLAAVSESRVRGFIRLAPERWYRTDRMTPVSAAEVARAAAAADLLAVRGDTTPWRSSGRSRILWPTAGEAADWYAEVVAEPSPLSVAVAGVPSESLPPLTAASPIRAAAWQGLQVRRARRGDPLPVVAGRISGGRSVVISADGFYQWAFRGGVAEQAWRSVIAAATSWLLSAPSADAAAAEPIDRVTERGRPVRFRASDSIVQPVPLTLMSDSDSVSRRDTLVWNADGEAELVLPVGHYSYQLAGGQQGTFAVEPYSAELFPAAARLTSHRAELAGGAARRSLRDLLPLFALIVIGLGIEWLIRRRLGLP